MSLLREIQASLMAHDQDIGPILLKFRFLASRLGSHPLAEWVRSEMDGYPKDAELPGYRVLTPTYKVDTAGVLGSGMRNAPVPPALISELAGDKWTKYKCRESIASIESLASAAKGMGIIKLDASNLMLILQDKIYSNDTIIAVTGSLPLTAMVQIQNVVRTKFLDLTIELEKETPFAADIVAGPVKVQVGAEEQQKVSQITNHVIHGNYTSISNSGVISGLMLSIAPMDSESVISALVEKGVAKEEAKEFTQILTEEKPESANEPFGAKAKSWIADRVEKMASGVWNIGIAEGTKILTEAALKYYGFK